MNPTVFQQSLQEKGIELTTKQLDQFHTYYELLVEWNKKMNLTSITDREEVFLKHFYDSITVSFYTNFTKETSLCDVGAGAGFPSIPLKICFPNLRVTIVDSLQKRIGFLEHLAEQLQLEQVQFFHDRAETFGKNRDFRESFDVVTARAVARMSVLSELCLPLVKKEGRFIAMKGSQGKEELEKAKKAIFILGGKVEDIHTFTLPKEESERSIIVIRKTKNTPKSYPRKAGTPNRNPIE